MVKWNKCLKHAGISIKRKLYSLPGETTRYSFSESVLKRTLSRRSSTRERSHSNDRSTTFTLLEADSKHQEDKTHRIGASNTGGVFFDQQHLTLHQLPFYTLLIKGLLPFHFTHTNTNMNITESSAVLEGRLKFSQPNSFLM